MDEASILGYNEIKSSTIFKINVDSYLQRWIDKKSYAKPLIANTQCGHHRLNTNLTSSQPSKSIVKLSTEFHVDLDTLTR